MKQSARKKRANSVYRPKGELTIYSAQDAMAELKQLLSAKCDVDVDLSEVTEMDSAGLQLLIMARNEAERQQQQFTLVGQSAAVMDVLELTNLAGLFGEPLVISSKKTGGRKSS